LILDRPHTAQEKRSNMDPPPSFHHIGDGELDLEILKLIFPLRFMLQLLGLWHPVSVPKIISWIHYLISFSLFLWFSIWKSYYIGKKYNTAVALLRGLDTIMYIFFWIYVPFIIHKRCRPLINSIQYVDTVLHISGRLSVIYGVTFLFLLLPQLIYTAMISLDTVSQKIAPAIPWPNPSHTVILALGMFTGVLGVNTTLLLLAVSSHLQSFLIKNFLETNLMSRAPIRMNSVKQMLHLTVNSLRQGNSAVEALNASMVIALLMSIVEIGSQLLLDEVWDTSTLLPLILILLQIYYFLIPPAYITHCWDKVFHECLVLHALALTPESELGPIVLYISNAYAGYHITNIRIDSNKIYFFTYAILTLLAIKVQHDVDFWILG